MEASHAEAGRPEPGPDVLHCPGDPEEGTDPRTHVCPAAQTQGCPLGPKSRTGTSDGPGTSEADKVLTAGLWSC